MPIQTVFVVDDDEQARGALCALAQSMDLPAVAYRCAEDFLRVYADQPGCLVLDYRLPGLNGIELQEEMHRRGFGIPVVFVTGYARTSLTVRAIKNGAVTVLDKPTVEDELWHAIRDALARDREHREASQQRQQAVARFDSLTGKELDVLRLLLAGKPNKVMASALDVSLRTIENRRRKIFSKLRVGSVAELVTLALTIRLDRPELWRLPPPRDDRSDALSARESAPQTADEES